MILGIWYNLGTLPQALAAYKQRIGIEEMFRDCKAGGYNARRYRVNSRQTN